MSDNPQLPYTLYLLVIPLCFAFTIHTIGSRYYSHDSKVAINLDFPIKKARDIINVEKAYTNFLPHFIAGASEIKKDYYSLPVFKGVNLGLLGGKGTVRKTRIDLLYLNNGLSFMFEFEVKSDNFKVLYEYTLTPREKDSSEKLELSLKTLTEYHGLLRKGVSKMFVCLFEDKQKQSLEVLKAYLEKRRDDDVPEAKIR